MAAAPFCTKGAQNTQPRAAPARGGRLARGTPRAPRAGLNWRIYRALIARMQAKTMAKTTCYTMSITTRSLTIPHLDSHITVTSHRFSGGKCMITDVAVSVTCMTHLQDSAHDDNYCTDTKTARQCTQRHVRWRWRLAWVIVAASVPEIPRLRGVHR